MSKLSPYQKLKRFVKDSLIKFCRFLYNSIHAIEKHILKNTLEQIRSQRNMELPAEKMDKEMLGQFIRFLGHSIEKTVRNEYSRGRGEEKFIALNKAIDEWQRRGYPDRTFIRWARENMEDYRKWNESKVPQTLPPEELPDLGENPAFFDVLCNRVSTRFWKDREIEPDKLERIIQAATHAPSSCNRQPWYFYVVKNEAPPSNGALCSVSNVSLREKAPVVIYITIDERLYPEKYAPAIDAGIAGLQMSLTASALGLGNCLMYGGENFPQEEIRQKYDIPKDQYIYLILLMGYPAETTLRNKRVDAEDASRFI